MSKLHGRVSLMHSIVMIVSFPIKQIIKNLKEKLIRLLFFI